MSSGNSTILVTGATGKTGSRISDRLIQAGLPVRTASRSAELPFDWHNTSTWPENLAGVKAAYISYYPDLAFPGVSEIIAEFSTAAVAAGVERLVLLSGRGEEGAEACERAVQGSGAEWTIVRCNWFNQNFSESFLLGPVLSGEVVIPAGDAVEPFVDVEDIADVAAAALTEPGHAGEVYELSGPRLMGFADVAAEISEATGKHVQYISVTPAEFTAVLEAEGLPLEFGELFELILDGRNAVLTDGVQRALGREPRDFRDFAREAAAAGAWDAMMPAAVG